MLKADLQLSARMIVLSCRDGDTLTAADERFEEPHAGDESRLL